MASAHNSICSPEQTARGCASAGNWSKALTLADNLQRGRAAGSGAPNVNWLTDTTSALQQLGCDSLIQTYCQGLSAKGQQGTHRLATSLFLRCMHKRCWWTCEALVQNSSTAFMLKGDGAYSLRPGCCVAVLAEARDECAWRLGSWAEPTPEGGRLAASADVFHGGDDRMLFHRALRGCLQALEAGQHDRWRTILTSSRQVSCIRTPSFSSGGSMHQQTAMLHLTRGHCDPARN